MSHPAERIHELCLVHGHRAVLDMVRQSVARCREQEEHGTPKWVTYGIVENVVNHAAKRAIDLTI